MQTDFYGRKRWAWMLLAMAGIAGSASAATCYDKSHVSSTCPDQGVALAEADAGADNWLAAYAATHPIPPYNPYKKCPPLLTINANGDGNYRVPFGVESATCAQLSLPGGSESVRFFPASCSARPPIVGGPGSGLGVSQCHDGCEYVGQGGSAAPTGNACTPPSFDPGKNNQCCVGTGGSVFAGNPINLFVGNKIETVRDFVDPMGHLNLSRYYSSALIIANQGTTLSPRWRHGYQANISSNTENGVQVWIVNRPSGDSYVFRPDGGNWKPDADVVEKLVATSNPTGWAVTAAGGEVERYDSAGRLLSITYLDGDVVSVTYDGSNRPILIEDRRGRALSLAYAGGLLDKAKLPDGKLVRYAYNAQRLTSVLYQTNDDALSPQFATVQYLYEDTRNPQLLTGVVDESSQRYAAWEYDGFGRAISSRHGSATGGIELVSISRGAGGSWLTNPLGDTVEYTYQQQFGRARIASMDKICPTCPGASAEARTYDANGFLDLSADFDGSTTDHDYNAAGLEIQRIEAANDITGKKRTTQTDWNATFRVPTERRTYNAANTLVAQSTWTYNTRGQALTASQIDPVTAAVRTATTTYCEPSDVTAGTCPLLGLVTATNGARTDVTDTTTYTYYASDDATCVSSPTTCPHRKGDLWKATDALGRITETLAYDGAGRPLSVKDANSVITDLAYHPRGWLTARKVRGTNNAVETDDQITAIEYWPTGLVKKVTQPDGAFTAYTYDAAHRLTDIADNAGNTIHYTLDNAGHRTAEATKDSGNTLRRSLSRIYNQLGQLQTAKDAYSTPPASPTTRMATTRPSPMP